MPNYVITVQIRQIETALKNEFRYVKTKSFNSCEQLPWLFVSFTKKILKISPLSPVLSKTYYIFA